MPSFKNRPTHLQKSGTALTLAGLQGLGGRVPPHLSIASNQFKPVDAMGNADEPFRQTHVDCVVLDINPNKSKLLFDPDLPYAGAGGSPPICFANNGEAPSIDSPEPQSRLCVNCYWNSWGSGEGLEGKKTKKCKDYKKIVIYVVSPRYPHILLLSIPPNSFGNWASYLGYLGNNGAGIGEVITRISFAPRPSGTLVFDTPESGNGEVQWVTPKFQAWYEAQDHNKMATMLGLTERAIDDHTPLQPRPEQIEWLASVHKAAAPTSVAVEANKPPPPARIVKEEPQPEAATPPPPEEPRRVGRPRKAQPTPPPSPPVEEVPEFIERTSPHMVNGAPEPSGQMENVLDDAFDLP